MVVPDDMRAGTVFPTRKWGELVILDYKGSKEVDIKFLSTGTLKTTRAELIRTGVVEDVFSASRYGFGFLGEGPYSSSKVQVKEYQTWSGMLERCYCPKLKLSRHSYSGVLCDPQWHNFQEFAEWCQWQVGFKNIGWELDKDIMSITLGRDCGFYSPETCVFLPKEVNTFLTKFSSRSKELPLGVTKDKLKKDKFRAYLTYRSKDYSFRANTVEECYNWYLEKNSECISDIISRFSSQVDERALYALEQLKHHRWKA